MGFNSKEDDWKELVSDVDGFYNEETDPEIQGKVSSITEMQLAGRDTLVAVIILTAPCRAVTGAGDEKKEIELLPGQAVGVVIKHKLGDLPSFVDENCEVQIKAKDKIKVPGGKTMWRYAVRFRGRRTGLAAAGAKTAARPAPQASETKDAEKEAKAALESY